MTSPSIFPWPSITRSSKRPCSDRAPSQVKPSARGLSPMEEQDVLPPAAPPWTTTTRSSVYECSWLSRLVEFLLPLFSGMVRHHDDQHRQSPATKWRGVGMDRQR